MCTTCATHPESKWEKVDIPTHRFADGDWVRVTVEIRDNTTGEVRRYTTNDILDRGAAHPSPFNWAENNNSCDCNRGLFFGYAAERSYEEMEATNEIACGRERYSVRLINPVDNRAYYEEFAPA